MLMKSAVSSSQTIIFIPSYFDFVRVKRYMLKMDNFSFTSISEYVLPSLGAWLTMTGTPRRRTSVVLAAPSLAARCPSCSSPSASTSSVGASCSPRWTPG